MKGKNLLVVLCFVLTACAATGTPAPQTPMQNLYVLEQSVVIAVNALADVHDSGKLVGPNYEKAKVVETQIHTALDSAKKAAAVGDTTNEQVYLTTLNDLLNQLVVYNGGKR